MLSFRRFLAEKFLQGAEGKHRYTEIFINPSPDELLIVGNRHTPVSSQLFYLGKNYVFFGGILADRNLYVFDREAGEHQDVADALGDKLPYKEWLPLDMYYWPKLKTGAVIISRYTLSNMMGHSTEPSAEQYVEVGRHPVVKRLFKTCLRTNNKPL
jgi:hypothetical protein